MLSADGSGFNDSPGGHTLAFPVPEDTTRFSVHEKEQAGDHDRGDQREQPQHHPRSSSLEGNEVEGELRTPPYTPSSLAPSHVDTTTGTQECLRLLSEFATKLRENTSWDTDHNDDDQLVSSLTMLMTEEADYTKTMADLDLLEGFVTVWIRAAEICANKFPMPTIPARLVSPMSKGKAPARQTPSPEPRPHAPPTNDYFEHFPEATVNFPQPEEAASSSMLSAAIGESSSHMPPRAASPILPPLVEEDDGHDDPRVHRCYTEVIADPNDDMAINIKLMDRVRLEIEMDDRVTGIGTNLNTGAMGSFPLSCLVVPSDVDIRPHDGSPFNGNRNSIMSLAAATPIIEQTPPGRGFADAHTPQFTAHHIVASPLTESPKMPNALHASASFPPDNMSAGPSTTPGPVSPTSLHRPASLSSRVSIVSTSSANSASESQYSAAYDRMSMISAEFDDLHALPARGASIQRHNQNNPVPLPPRSSSTSAVPPPLPEPRTQRDSKASFSSYASSSGPVTPPVQLSRELSAQVLEKRKYARQVIEELFETERNFRDGMQVLIDQFMLPLGQACIASSTGDSSDQIITRMEHSVLFRNIPGLRNLSRKICGLLQAAMDRAESDQQNLTGGGAVGAVVDVFLIKVEFEEWSTYVRYMEGFAHSKTTYDNLKKREAFKAMLYRCESAKECNRQSFDHYIILPVQRISRYHLLLSRLKQVTDPEDPVHQSIETAEQYMKQIGDVLEAVQKQEEELRTVFSVFSEIKGCPPDIISASRRRLLSAFEVDELYSGRRLQMHVFSDCFLISTDSCTPPYVVPTVFKLPSAGDCSATLLAPSNHTGPALRRPSLGSKLSGTTHHLSGLHGNVSPPSLIVPAHRSPSTSSSTKSSSSSSKRSLSHYHYASSRSKREDKNDDKGDDNSGSGSGGGGSSSGSSSGQHKYVFVARVYLRDLEVQSVAACDDGSTTTTIVRPGAANPSRRVVVLRHVPGSGAERKSPPTPLPDEDLSSASGLPPPTPTSGYPSGYPGGYPSGGYPLPPALTPTQGRTNDTYSTAPTLLLGAATASSPPLAHPHVPQNQAGVQELYAFRARDASRMAGLLAALGLAGVRF